MSHLVPVERTPEQRLEHIEYLAGALYHRVEQIRSTLSLAVMVGMILLVIVFALIIYQDSQQTVRQVVPAVVAPVQKPPIGKAVHVHRSTVSRPPKDSPLSTP
jgi:hypothetical protein